MSTGTSPTLTLIIKAPEALTALAALRKELDATKASMAGLNAAGGGSASNSAVKQLQAQVAELAAGLRAAQIQLEVMGTAAVANSAKTVSATQKETAAVKEKASAVKAAALEEKAAAESAAAYRLSLQLASGKMTGTLAIAQAAAAAKTIEQEKTALNALGMAQRLQAAKAASAIELSIVLQSEKQQAEAYVASMRSRVTTAIAAEKEIEAARLAALKVQSAAANAAAREQAAVQKAAQAEAAGVGRSAARGVALAGGASFLTYGQSIPALAAAFAGAATIKEGVTAGAEFQKQMAFVQIASEDTAESIARLSEKMLKLGENSLFKPTEMALGMRVLAQAGLTAQESFTALTPVMNLAAIGEQTVGQAAETAAGMMHAFGLGVNDITHIGDALAKAANLSQTNVNEMSQAMRQASTVAQQYNINVDEMSAMLSILATRNIRGTAAGTALTNMLREMDPASATARRAFKAIGVDLLDSEGNMKRIVPLLQEFSKKFSEFSLPAQNRLSADFWNNRGQKGALTLMKESGELLPKFLADIQASSEGVGYLAKSVDILGDNVDGAWKKLKAAFEAEVIKAFNQESGALKSTLERLKDTVTSPDFQSGLNTLLTGFAMAAEAAAQMASAIGFSVGGWKQLVGLMKPEAGVDQYPAGSVGDNLRKSAADAKARRERLFGSTGNNAFAPMSLLSLPKISGVDDLPYNGLGPLVGKGTPAAGTRDYKRIDADAEAVIKAQIEQTKKLSADKLAALAQADKYELAQLDAKHKYGLISEATYSANVEAANKKRSDDSLDIVDTEIGKLLDLRRAQAREQDRIATDTAIKDAQYKRAQIVSETNQATVIRGIRLKGEKITVERDTDAQLRALSTGFAQDRDKARLGVTNQLQPEVVAARAAAEFNVREKMKTDLLMLDKELEKHQKDLAEISATALDDEVVGLNGVIGALLKRKQALTDLGVTEVKVNGDAAASLKEYERSFEFGLASSMMKYQDDATNAAQNTRTVFAASMTSMTDALLAFETTGKFSFKSFANTVVIELLKIQNAKMAAGFLGTLTSLIPGLGGSAGYGTAGTAAGTALVPGPGGGLYPTLHTGGIVGGTHAMTRTVSSDVFAGARKYHTGGLVNGDVPIIAKHGEGVFTPEQMSRLAPAGGNSSVEVTVNVLTGETTAQASGADPVTAKALGALIAAGARVEIQKQQRPGGLLDRKARN